MGCSVEIKGSAREIAELFGGWAAKYEGDSGIRDCRIAGNHFGSVETRRFLKMDDQGNQLSEDATTWAAVFDRKTGLMWDAGNVSAERLKWDAAKKAASEVTLCGFEDWRLPDVEELLSIVDRSRTEPAIDTKYFRDTKSAWYWSSSPVAGSSDFAWGVNFYNGNCDWYDVYYDGFVRAVRSARPGQ